MVGRDDDIRKAFTNNFTKKALIEKFGDRRSAEGFRLDCLLTALPDQQTFETLDELVDMIADKAAALIKGLGTDASLRASVGVAAGSESKTAPVGNLEGSAPT